MAEFKFPDEPTLAPMDDLPTHAEQWRDAATASNLGISPFTAKAYYTFGLIRHSIEASGWLLERERNPKWRGAFYVSAYLQTSTAVELLGRCRMGDQRLVRGSGDRLRRGLQDIAELPDDEPERNVTPNGYTIGRCKALRNFAAHGSGAAKDPIRFDPQFIKQIVSMLADALGRYGEELQEPTAREPRNALADAAIMPLFYEDPEGNRPIFIKEVHTHLNNGGSVASGLLHSDVWRT